MWVTRLRRVAWTRAGKLGNRLQGTELGQRLNLHCTHLNSLHKDNGLARHHSNMLTHSPHLLRHLQLIPPLHCLQEGCPVGQLESFLVGGHNKDNLLGPVELGEEVANVICSDSIQHKQLPVNLEFIDQDKLLAGVAGAVNSTQEVLEVGALAEEGSGKLVLDHLGLDGWPNLAHGLTEGLESAVGVSVLSADKEELLGKFRWSKFKNLASVAGAKHG